MQTERSRSGSISASVGNALGKLARFDERRNLTNGLRFPQARQNPPDSRSALNVQQSLQIVAIEKESRADDRVVAVEIGVEQNC